MADQIGPGGLEGFAVESGIAIQLDVFQDKTNLAVIILE